MSPSGTYTQHPTLLATLPPLVRKQRRLEARVAKVAQDVKDEKAVREEIDRLLLAAGLKKSQLVTCAGYDVLHNERDGRESLNPDMVTAGFVALGVDPEAVKQVVKDATETGEPAKFATIKPSKGARVRAPQQEAKATMRLLDRGTAADRKRA
jgi:hypothetical protein